MTCSQYIVRGFQFLEVSELLYAVRVCLESIGIIGINVLQFSQYVIVQFELYVRV